MCVTPSRLKQKRGLIRLSLGKAKGKDVVSTWYNLYITCRCTSGTDFSIIKYYNISIQLEFTTK